jgi:uncharacterized protein (TIGR02611 family)
MTEELRQDIQRRVNAVQRRYHQGGPMVRAVWVIAAVVVVLAGLAMLVLPGPALLVIPIGLAMLAVRYRWAQWALGELIDRGVRVQRRFARRSRGIRLMWSVAVCLVVVAGYAVVR